MITCRFENGGNATLRHVVVHAVAYKDGKLLLVKRAKTLSLEGGKWALPGGFLDRDENGEQAVLRELREETGWDGKVEVLFMIKTDPNRPHEDRQNVALSYIVTPTVKTGGHDKESSTVSWVPVDSLPSLDMLAFDHGQIIDYYLKYRNSAFALPVIC